MTYGHDAPESNSLPALFMTSAERLGMAKMMQKAALANMAGKALQVGGKMMANPMVRRVGIGAIGAAGLYGGYRALKPNNQGILGQSNRAAVQQSNDLNQVYDFANPSH